MVIDRKTTKRIEYYLRNYQAIKMDLENIREARDDVILSSPPPSDGLPHGTSVGNPTESKAMNLAKMEENRKWIDIIDDTLLKFKGTGKDNLMILRYFEGASPSKTARKLYIDIRTVFRWQQDIIYYIALLSVSKKLISV
ncbi:hypothetical protein [Acetivibrio sp. MSJd-27]|uniref:hypothetical protein n=1 Tax=Acetivibrio sp. MSJd-27 TaxID=2841523 RepID=UPI001C0FB5B1|nr:hypothetical protein [Acetivibrio sp. MSJd-27]MBU5451289.1 hypothetical protein [Acetivibrio sp. MSJd-27]